MTDKPLWDPIHGSSDVEGFRYEGGDLIILFKRGAVYRYHGVSEATLADFRGVRSKGGFLRQLRHSHKVTAEG